MFCVRDLDVQANGISFSRLESHAALRFGLVPCSRFCWPVSNTRVIPCWCSVLVLSLGCQDDLVHTYQHYRQALLENIFQGPRSRSMITNNGVHRDCTRSVVCDITNGRAISTCLPLPWTHRREQALFYIFLALEIGEQGSAWLSNYTYIPFWLLRSRPVDVSSSP